MAPVSVVAVAVVRHRSRPSPAGGGRCMVRDSRRAPVAATVRTARRSDRADPAAHRPTGAVLAPAEVAERIGLLVIDEARCISDRGGVGSFGAASTGTADSRTISSAPSRECRPGPPSPLRRPVFDGQPAADGPKRFLDLADVGTVVGVEKPANDGFADGLRFDE